MGFNYTRDEVMQMSMNSSKRKLDEIESRLAVVEKKLASDQYFEEAEWVNSKCSICGKGIEDLIESREWYENEKPNYCPFCGKKFKRW